MASEEFLLGRCQIRLRDIEIDLDYCRERIDAAVACLSSVFEDPNKFNPYAELHQFPIVTNPEQLRQLLDNSGVSHSSFTESQLHGPYPRLTSHHGKLRCIHGRQRYEAAIGSQKLGPDTWWTVKLYCLPEGVDPRILLYEEVEQDHYQTKYNDGHVFCAVLYWGERGDMRRVNSWRKKLPENKQKSLGILLKLTPVKERLSRLRVFHGLLDALKLGNVEKMVNSHGLPQICRNLDRIYEVWNNITLGEPRVQRAASVATVQRLQMLAPSASHSDRHKIQELMQTGQVFPTLRDLDLRARIQQRILQIEGLIPSVESFHQNMKYLNIVNHVIRSNLITTIGKGEAVSEAMSSLWTRPDACLVEYAQGQFLRPTRPPSQDLSYLILVAAALRDFPRLCNGDYMGPRCEVGGNRTPAVRDQAAVDRFRLLAHKIGYSVATTGQPLPTAVVAEQLASEPAEGPVERRWNRPYADSARFCASRLFLPELFQDRPIAAYPGTLFVQRDFIRSFFSEIPHLTTVVRLPSQLPEPSVQPYTLRPDPTDGATSSTGSQSDTRFVDPGDHLVPTPLENTRRHGWAPMDFTGFVWPTDEDAEALSLPRLSNSSEADIFLESLRSSQSSQSAPEGSRTLISPFIGRSSSSTRLLSTPSTRWRNMNLVSARSVDSPASYSRLSTPVRSVGHSSIRSILSSSPRSRGHSMSSRLSISPRSAGLSMSSRSLYTPQYIGHSRTSRVSSALRSQNSAGR